MSFSGDLAMGILRLFNPGKGSAENLEKSRKKYEAENAKGRDFRLPADNKKASFELIPGTEYPCILIHPRKKTDADSGKALLYIYGGVTRLWKMQLSIAVDLANRSGLPVWYPVYPSVTEVNITQSIEVLYQVYRLMKQRYDPKKIAVIGLSYGGTFAMQLINRNNRDADPVPMPGLVVCHSPGGIPDTEEDLAELRKYEPRDPFFTVSEIQSMTKIMPDVENTPPHALAPIREDFHNAPPTWMYYGEEVLAGNAPAYRKAFERDGSGNRLHIEIVKNMMHGYSCMPVFPERKKAYNEMLENIRKF